MSEEQVLDLFAPQEEVFINFGEIAYYQWMIGTWEAGSKAPIAYDKDRHNWSSLYHHLQAFPIGRDNPDWEQWLMPTKPDWKVFYDSIAKIQGNASAFLKAHLGNQFYAKWEKVKAGGYKKDGEWKDKYGYKILAIYPDLATAQTAYDEHRGNAPLPVDSILPTEERVVATVPLAQILPFAETMARQHLGADHKVDLVAFAVGIDASPMLAGFYNLGADGNPIEPKTICPDVMGIINKIEQEPII